MTNCTDCRYQENMCKWPCDDCVKGDKWEEKPFTYADRIRAMTDEELAEWTATLPCCPPDQDLDELCYPQNECENTDFARQCWLNWLKQEVTDEMS